MLEENIKPSYLRIMTNPEKGIQGQLQVGEICLR